MESPLKKSRGFLTEFKDFASRGNVVDMAVGVVLGTAFSTITNSLVNDIFMPLIGFLFGDMDFSQFNLVLQEEVRETMLGIPTDTVLKPEISINMGSFLGTIVNFLLVAFAMFLFVKAVNTIRSRAEAQKKAEAVTAPPEPSNEEKLLTEIRDLLEARNASAQRANAPSETNGPADA